MIKKIKKILGIDGAILYTIIARILQALGSLLNIFLISVFLSKEQQGYFYTFSSIIAVQIFFELGLNSIITQFVAHEVVHLRYNSNFTYSGSPEHLSRLSSLLRFCLKVFSFVSLILFISLIIAGNLFFNHYGNNSSSISWKYPWLLLCFSTSLILIVNPIIGYLQGLGKVKEVAKILLIQQIAVIITTSIVLVCKGGLFASGISTLASVLVLIFHLIFSNRKKVLLFIWKSKREWTVNYMKEIFPFQWKIALSWISGYFIFQLFNPVLFATEGPVIAGKMGMTLAVLNGVSSLTMSWISTKVPNFSSLISKQDFITLDKIFNNTLKQMLILSLILFSSLIFFIYILSFYNFKLSNRFLSIEYLVVLSCTSLVNLLIFSWATYLRCHKKEPFLINSIAIGALCAFSTTVIGNKYGLNGVIGGYAIITLFISAPWSFLIFYKNRNKWHLI